MKTIQECLKNRTSEIYSTLLKNNNELVKYVLGDLKTNISTLSFNSNIDNQEVACTLYLRHFYALDFKKLINDINNNEIDLSNVLNAKIQHRYLNKDNQEVLLKKPRIIFQMNLNKELLNKYQLQQKKNSR